VVDETAAAKIPKLVADGHYYSPVVDTESIVARKNELWPPVPPLRGVDYRERAQHALFEELVPLIVDFDFRVEEPKPGEPRGFYFANPMFGGLDALIYFGLLRKLRPERVLEVGAGHSTLLAVETRERFLGGEKPLIACIEPYPAVRTEPLLGKVGFIKSPVWEANPALVDALGPGDVFFVDCSHVSKTGADTHTIYFDLLPRLAPGVYVQIHDIALPFEYPYNWVVEDGRHWNEQYLVHALLTDSTRYEVVFASYFFSQLHADAIENAFGAIVSGGSLWLRVRDETTPRRS
jgi:hypothetical protein